MEVFGVVTNVLDRAQRLRVCLAKALDGPFDFVRGWGWVRRGHCRISLFASFDLSSLVSNKWSITWRNGASLRRFALGAANVENE